MDAAGDLWMTPAVLRARASQRLPAAPRLVGGRHPYAVALSDGTACGRLRPRDLRAPARRVGEPACPCTPRRVCLPRAAGSRPLRHRRRGQWRRTVRRWRLLAVHEHGGVHRGVDQAGCRRGRHRGHFIMSGLRCRLWLTPIAGRGDQARHGGGGVRGHRIEAALEGHAHGAEFLGKRTGLMSGRHRLPRGATLHEGLALRCLPLRRHRGLDSAVLLRRQWGAQRRRRGVPGFVGEAPCRGLRARDLVRWHRQHATQARGKLVKLAVEVVLEPEFDLLDAQLHDHLVNLRILVLGLVEGFDKLVVPQLPGIVGVHQVEEVG
mmetsp:Transcript_118399/g.339893  ORF Transcript_118399/g.339893 Transcript_118399/m.339893 type:complete len:321 (-) Transcript_118399:1576-2538(-)